MDTLQQFLQNYGLAAVFLAAMFEGDLTLMLTGLLAHLGMLPLGLGVGVGAAGGLTGDLFYFSVGRKLGARLRYGRLAQAESRVERWTQRWGLLSLFPARYIYGMRIAATIYWGTRQLSYARFMLVDSLNCALWASVYASMGFLFSQSIAALADRMRHLEVSLLLGLVVFVFVVLGLRWLTRRMSSS